MKKSLAQLFVALLIAFASTLVYLHMSALYLPFENKIKDLMFKVRGEIKGNENIIIIDIDERSLKELGQWPWSRDVVSKLLQNLAEYEVGIVGLDIVFAEPDNSSPKKVFQKLGLKSDGIADYDALLAETISNTPTIVGYIFALSNDGIKPDAPPKSNAIIIERDRPKHSSLIKPYRTILNIESIQEGAYSSGYFNTIQDNDGVVRSIPLVMEYNGILYPSLSLEMTRIMLDKKKIAVAYDDRGVSQIELGETIIPTDFFARMQVNYRGKQSSYRYISAVDVYNKTEDASHIKGKIALLGTSAAGLLDLRSTPFDSVFAGVEVHANAIDNIINGNFISKPIWAVGVDIASITILALLTFAILLLPSATLSFISFVFLNSIIVGTHYYLMMHKGVMLDTFILLLTLSVLFVLGQAINYFLEIKQKEMIKGKFASKVSPAVMNDLLLVEGDIFTAKEREISIFFSDVRGFTNISEAMGDPKSLIHLMNTYMDPMTEIIIKSHGTVDKFIGDAIMAYWNAPNEVENHADVAVCAALNQLHALKELNEQIRLNPEFKNAVLMADEKGIPIIDIGIGINTGMAIVGEMGSSSRSDYTVMGDPINLGSRLESLCKYYSSKLNISNFTKAQLNGNYIFRFLDLVTVKGKSEPIEIWQIHDYDKPLEGTLYGVTKEELEEELKIYHHAISLYKDTKFNEALEIFKTVDAKENKTNKMIYGIYIERCQHYLEIPPQNFNGVFVHTSKG
ncbi:CHASE2 domain-containing protein [Sulfurimonas sp.]|uniref:CHASE2 domain-containing protein n=1 Tax=Sulfurimonas sp. TaxID=2022749 RepID=UPI002605D9CD|nr:adenylate/guanylate cyclase domain-containing protein [Sulfurimonas sp.]MDD5156679.1 adenylate/guanylate cyclase domain-containing protein [Sulfurimonas sp.]